MSILKKNRFTVAAVFALCLLLKNAHAASFEEDLQTMWEVLWDERGTIDNIYKWETGKPIYYRFTGNVGIADKAHAERAIADTRQLVNVMFTPAPAEISEQELALEIRFIPQSSQEIADNNGCQANTLRARNWRQEQVRLYIRNGRGFSCTHHELLHAMGLRGHPEGKTVLTYFPWRRDQYLRLDELMLKAWYDEKIPLGSSPLRVLKSFAEALENDNEYSHSKEIYAEKKKDFFLKILAEMEAFSVGKAEAPKIVHRSGRAMAGNLKLSRQRMPYYLGLAYRDGILGERLASKAQNWLELSAKRGYLPAQLELARGFGRADFGQQSLESSAVWLGIAAKTNSKIVTNQALYDSLLKGLSDDQQTNVKAKVEAFVAESDY